MILTGNEINKMVKKGFIKIDPFSSEHITTNSYDLTLGDDILIYHDELLDPKKKNRYEILKIPKEGYELQSGDFVLAHSNEIIGSNNFVPIIHGKSGVARLGLFIHITAGLFDIGSFGQVTFQLYSSLPVRLYPGMKIAQVTFWEVSGEINLYQGKYQGSVGPKPSEIFKDWEQNKNL